MFRSLASLFIASCFLPVCAQETGTLRMLIDPGHDFSFIVDHKHRMQQREVKLSEGLHHFSIWAPERVIVDTTVFVIADRTTDLLLRLPFSADHLEYRKQLANYQTKKRWVRTVPIVAMAGGLVWSGISIGQYGKAKKALDKDRADYEINVDPGTLSTLKGSKIPAHNADLKKARTSLIGGLAFTAIGAGATYYLFRLTSKWDRPLFDDREKVRFDGMAWIPGAQGGILMAGLTIELSRP